MFFFGLLLGLLVGHYVIPDIKKYLKDRNDNHDNQA